jgi:hypothetical protein
MGNWEDLFYEIHEDIEKYGLRKEYNAQLEKMNGQEKHQYKEARDRMRYAYDKVIAEYHKKNNKVKSKT